MKEELDNLVDARTLAKMLNVSATWVTQKASHLSAVMVGGRLFFRVQESKILAPKFYKMRKAAFNNPAKIPLINLTMEKEDVEQVIQSKPDGQSWTNFYREAIRKYCGLK